MEDTKNVKIKDLLIMSIVSYGVNMGTNWAWIIDLPSCFTNNAECVTLSVNTETLDVVVCVVGKGFNFYSIEEVKERFPSLYASIVTRAYDKCIGLKC